MKTAVVCALLLSIQLCSGQEPAPGGLSDREKLLLDRIEKLEARIAALESRSSISGPAPVPETQPVARQEATSDPLRGTTLNLYLDTYYAYNFNSPIGRANLLRAYDVSSNSFSLNQAAVVLENAADPAHGKRFGARLDLQFGQATQTLQGNGSNEPRPEIYRSVFQAYGTYVAPIGHGLTIDFGKWASALGPEGNYTKDQNNYSRSFLFDFLPFYHEGVRATYKLNDRIAANYWIVNGTQQTEAFNGFKDELFGLVLTPNKNINWTINYYLGQEHPDVTYFSSGIPAGLPSNLPTNQGVPFLPIANPPNGRLHVVDSYVSWNASPRLSFALEGDDVINRLLKSSPPVHTAGGAVYGRYQISPRFAGALRGEYLTDRGGLFTGKTQALKESTFTLDYRLEDNFLLRGEWRRDFSNQPYFYTDTLGILGKKQTTATIGIVWWYGQKQGIW